MTGDLPESFTALSSMANMYLQNNQFTGSIDVLSNLPLHNLNIGNNHFSGWIPERLKNINIQREGNSWSSGPAPPPLPRTPPSSSSNRNRKQNDNKNSSDGGGSKKSGIGGGGVAGIVISILVVGAVVAFFAVIKKRSKRSSTDVEKADSQPFTSYASQEVQGTNLLHPIEKTCLTSFFN
nr:PREDICTED: protein STRUBBELIG-RECEPTOR FAMILY 7-like isoform X1 [Daucus carota subsp. sativus]